MELYHTTKLGSLFIDMSLMNHYVKTLGAVPIGGQRMAIEEKQALELIKRYFNDKK